MIRLSSGTLSVDVLHPVEDRDRLGPRFCTGGYVYQVRQEGLGDLLSGPEYPAKNPSVINGQGMPDVFQHTLYRSPADVPDRRLVIGVGLVENSARLRADQSHFTSAVEEYCPWEIRTSTTDVRMRATQHLQEWGLEISRRVSVDGRRVSIETGLSNRGEADLPYRWFAHPFFPIPPGLRCGVFPAEYSLESNPGFRFEGDGQLIMNGDVDWHQGHFTLVRCEQARGPLRVLENHPRTGTVEISCSFRPARLALWANDRTFSFEPFVEGRLAPGESAGWEISTTFGGCE